MIYWTDKDWMRNLWQSKNLVEKVFITYLKKNVQNLQKSFLIVARLFLFYWFAMWHCIIYFIQMHVITGQSTSWSVIDICDIVKYVSMAKAFVDIFTLKTFCLPTGEKSQQLYGLGKKFGFPQAFETYVWKVKRLKIKLKIVLIWKMTSPLFYWALLTHSSISWPSSWPHLKNHRMLIF